MIKSSVILLNTDHCKPKYGRMLRSLLLAATLSFTALQLAGQWSTLPQIPMVSFGGGYTFTFGNDIYVGFREQLYKYNTTTSTWTPRQSFIGQGSGRKWATAFTIGSTAYVGLGTTDGSVFRNDFYAYDPVQNSWSARAQFPGTARGGASVFVLNGMAYVCGGTSTSGTFSQVYRYDPVADAWSQVSTLPTGNRGFTAAFTIGSYGYVYGGYTGFGNETNQLHRYDPASNTWLQMANFPGGGRQSAVGVALNGMGLVGLGHAGFTSGFSNFYLYDPASNTWSSAGSFPAGNRFQCVAAVLDNELFVGAGSDLSFQDYDDWRSWSLEVGLLEESDSEDGIVLYPSPSFDQLLVNAAPELNATVSVIDTQGRLVITSRMRSGSVTLPVANLPTGVYSIILDGNDAVRRVRRFLR